MGKLLVAGGILVAAIGALMMMGVPFGRLPGDLLIRRGHATVYLPFVTSVVVSILLSILLALIRR